MRDAKYPETTTFTHCRLWHCNQYCRRSYFRRPGCEVTVSTGTFALVFQQKRLGFRHSHNYNSPPHFVSGPGVLSCGNCPPSHHHQEADRACLEVNEINWQSYQRNLSFHTKNAVRRLKRCMKNARNMEFTSAHIPEQKLIRFLVPSSSTPACSRTRAIKYLQSQGNSQLLAS